MYEAAVNNMSLDKIIDARFENTGLRATFHVAFPILCTSDVETISLTTLGPTGFRLLRVSTCT